MGNPQTVICNDSRHKTTLRSTIFIHYKEIYYFSSCCQQIFCGKKLWNLMKYCYSSNFHKLILASLFFVLLRLINMIPAKFWFSNFILYCIFIIIILISGQISLYIYISIYYLHCYKNTHIQMTERIIVIVQIPILMEIKY